MLPFSRERSFINRIEVTATTLVCLNGFSQLLDGQAPFIHQNII